MAISFLRTAVVFSMAATSLANAAGYDVAVRGGNKLVAITFATKDTVPEPCWLEASQITLELPATATGVGKIAFTTRVNKAKDCFQTEGPQRGVLGLQTEEDARLPALPYGRYQLVIDGQAHGLLSTSAAIVELAPEKF